MNQPKKASVSSIPMPAANDTDAKNRMKRAVSCSLRLP